MYIKIAQIKRLPKNKNWCNYDTIFDLCDRFLCSLFYYSLIMFCYLSYIIGSIFILHYMSVHSVFVLENVFDVAKIHRDCSSDSLRAIENIILLSQSSIPNPFFPLATVILESPTETDEDIDIVLPGGGGIVLRRR